MTVAIKEFGKERSATVIGVTTTANDAIANTTTETLLEDFTILANTLKAGDVYHFRASGLFTVTSTPTLTVALYVGDSSILSSGALTVTGASSSPIIIDGYFTVLTTGSTGTITSDMTIRSTTEAIIYGTMVDATATVDTTDDLALTLSFDWSAASSSNTITISNFFCQKL